MSYPCYLPEPAGKQLLPFRTLFNLQSFLSALLMSKRLDNSIFDGCILPRVRDSMSIYTFTISASEGFRNPPPKEPRIPRELNERSKKHNKAVKCQGQSEAKHLCHEGPIDSLHSKKPRTKAPLSVSRSLALRSSQLSFHFHYVNKK